MYNKKNISTNIQRDEWKNITNAKLNYSTLKLPITYYNIDGS
jgi:hypothetical protein